ncbi:MAG: TRAP transporter large permease subunit [Gammaproteobacteria bacterium]
MELIPLILLIMICVALLMGYPVAFTLAGLSILFALICIPFGIFDPTIFKSIPIRRYFGIMNNMTLLAVPLFIFMGTILEKSGIAAKMLENMADAFKNTKGGLSISIIIVGALLAASTGIVGATVVTMGLMSLPILINQGYEKSFSTGLVASTGTLGQIIPPSIALVLLGDVMSNAFQAAKYSTPGMSSQTVTVGDLFIGAIVPGIMICIGYLIYAIYKNKNNAHLKDYSNEKSINKIEIFKTLALPVILILSVLGSIFAGIATPTEASAIGAFGALIIALINRKVSIKFLMETSEKTAVVSTMIFAILIGASIFSLIFRGVGGDELINLIFSVIPGGSYTALFFVLLIIFLLGFILDFIEICYVIVPLVAPPLLMMGLDPVWLAILFAIILQTSFLTPPFGFSLFYLRGVADESIKTADIYKGVVPFIIIQLCILFLVIIFPGLIL